MQQQQQLREQEALLLQAQILQKMEQEAIDANSATPTQPETTTTKTSETDSTDSPDVAPTVPDDIGGGVNDLEEEDGEFNEEEVSNY